MHDALLLNADFTPVGIVAWQRAVCLVLDRKVRVVEPYPGKQVRAPTFEMDWPAVVHLVRYVRVKASPPLNRMNVLARDRFRCSYCGLRPRNNGRPDTSRLTLDHVVPRSRARDGYVHPEWARRPVPVTSWQNLVAACGPCNHRKGCRTPDEAGLTLATPPPPPTPAGRHPRRTRAGPRPGHLARLPAGWGALSRRRRVANRARGPSEGRQPGRDRIRHRSPGSLPVTILVVDVEATCWPDTQPELRRRQRAISEIIEIGAVRLEGAPLRETGEYQAFVRPEAHPQLSPFCTELTSIEQSDVARAPVFTEAMDAFEAWIGQADDLVMMSWSAYDQHLFVRQCDEHGRSAPAWTHIDLKAEYGRWVFAQDGTRARHRLAQALDRVGVDVTGTAHRALDDARNTAALLRHIRDPGNTSLLTRHTLRHMRDRRPRPTHLGHVREVVPDARRWFPRIRYELLRCGLARDLGDGKGLVLTAYAERVLPALELDALPPPADPTAVAESG